MEDDLRQNVRSAAKRLAGRSIIVIGAMLIISAWAWARIPVGKLVPIHWGPSGQVNGYAPKAIGLFWAPGIAAMVSLLLAAFLLLPRSETVARSTKAYVAVSTTILVFLMACHIVAVLVTVGQPINVPAAIVTMAGIMFVILGNYMGKMRRNRWMGIRTPWTRSSELCWDRTHRLGSRLFVGLGIVLIAAALAGVRPEYMAVILTVGIFGVTLLVYAYSYIVWRAEQTQP
jgi:uncharacterized membrane protein